MSQEKFSPHKHDQYIQELYRGMYGKDFDSSDQTAVDAYGKIVNKYGSDLSYLDSIEKYRGTSYYDTLYSNPYLLGRNKDYTPTGLESLGDTILDFASLGIAGSPFSSGGKARYEQDLLSQSNQFFTDTVDKYRQEQYNSEGAQAERLRQAGVNPDLTGGVSPGQASENDQPSGPVSMQGSQDANILQAASIPFTLVSGIMDMYKGIQGIEAANLTNVGQEIANNNNAKDFVLDSLAQAFISTGKDEPDLSSVENLLEAAEKADYSGYSRRTRKLISHYFRTYRNDAKHNGKVPLGLDKRIAELRGIVTRENWDSANIQSNPLYSDDFTDMVGHLYKYFGDMPVLLRELELESSIREAGYNSDYYGVANGAEAAQASNTANELSTSMNNHQKNIVDTYNQIDAKFKEAEDYLLELSNSKKRGAFFGTLGLMLLPTLKAQVFQGIHVSLPSINITHRHNNVTKSYTTNNNN